MELAEQELCEKYAADIHKLVERWETADRHIDNEYLDDLREARAEISTLRTALDETKERLRIAEKVIEDKNKQTRGTASDAGMTLNEYQSRAMETCLPSSANECYMLLGLVEEAGELCGKVSKAIRKKKIAFKDNDMVHLDSKIDEELNEQIKSETSDVLWFVAGLCRQFGWTLEDVAQYNLDKLAARKDAGTIVTHSDH